MECNSIFWHHHLQRYGCGHAQARAWLTQYSLDAHDDARLARVIANALDLSDLRWIVDNLGLFIGPLIAWGSHQPWHAKIDWRRASSKWCNAHIPRQCSIALGRMRPWIKHIHARYHTALVAHIWQDTSQKIDWTLSSPQEWRVGLDLGAIIHQLDNPEPFIEIWKSALMSSTKPTASFTIAVQIDRANEILKSDLPKNVIRDVLSAWHPKVWSSPSVAQALIALLPTSEFERFALLPWATAKEYETNESMIRLYCPDAYQILEWVARPYDWKNRVRIESLLQEQQPVLGLSIPLADEEYA